MNAFPPKPVLLTLCLAVAGAVTGIEDPRGESRLWHEVRLEDFQGPQVRFTGGQVVEVEGGRVGKLVVDKTSGPVAASLDIRDKNVELCDWDELVFDYRVSGPGLSWWGVKVIDHPLADGYQATWQIKGREALRPRVWHTAVIDLRKPMWRWGHKPNKNSQLVIFRAQLEKGAKPVTVWVDNVRLRGPAVQIRIVQESALAVRDRRASKDVTMRFRNLLSRPVACQVRVQIDKGLQAVGLPRRLELSAGEEVQLEVKLRVPELSKVAKLRPLSAAIELTEAKTGREISREVISLTPPLGQLPHPLLLIRRDEVEQVLAAAQKVPRLRKSLEGLLAAADGWLKRELDFPDRGSQWWHWYTCKKCGARLRTASPTKHVCPSCGAVYSGWPYDDVVLARQHGALANGARDLGLAYILTGKREYARRAADILLGYAQRYEKYPLHNVRGEPKGGGHVGPQTLDEATWLIPIVQAFDAVQDTLSEDERRQIVDHLLMPAARTTWSPSMSVHNISCWRNSAYGLVGLALDNEEMVEAAYAGRVGFLTQLRQGVIPPGFWYEGSWGYHFYTMHALLPFVEAGLRAGLDVLLDEYRAMYEAPLEFVAPDMRLPAFNDSGYSGLNSMLYAIAYRHWREPRFAWAASLRPPTGWQALIWGAREIGAGNASFVSRLYPEAGYAVFRTQGWGERAGAVIPPNYLALDFGPHGGGHGHPDKLNFAWWAYGRLMAPDAGSIAYGNPMHGGYYKQTLAHNTVIIDGKSQRPCTGKCLFYAADGDMGIVGASADEAYPGVELRRIVAVSGQRVIDITIARADRQRRMEWVYHNLGELVGDIDWEPMEAAPEGQGYSWCKNWRRWRPDGPFTVRWEAENRSGVVLYHLPEEGEVLLTALGPDQPPTNLVPLVIEQVHKQQAVWVNVLQAYSGERPKLTAQVLPAEASGKPMQAFAVEATDGTLRDVLLVHLGGGEVRAGPYRVVGQAALMHLDGSGLRQCLAAGSAAVWLGEEKVK